METVNLSDKFSRFSDYFNPRVIGELNDSQVKAVKFQGEFIWHHHDNEDELFLVVKGTLRMKFRDREARRPRGRIYHRAQRHGALSGSGRRSPHRLDRTQIHPEYR